jgi:hypothetical protein
VRRCVTIAVSFLTAVLIACAGPTSIGGAATSSHTGPGIGSAAALSAPDCDRASGKIKISFLYRPPCVKPWPAGANNGGATYQGVTATTIRVVIYNEGTNGVPFVSNSSTLTGMEKAAESYEHFYQMWGRKVQYVIVDGTGNDEVSERADALTIASLKPFAVVGAIGNTLIEDLAQRKIITIVLGVSPPHSLISDLAPYVWSPTQMDAGAIELNAAQYVGKRLLNQPARWAGEAAYQHETRKFALVEPEDWDVNIFKNEFSKYGGRLTDVTSYDDSFADISSQAEQATVIVARLKSMGVTSVIVATDLYFTAALTQAAAEQHWFPEWIMTGYGLQDATNYAQTFNQAEWAHAFGIGLLQVPVGTQGAKNGEPPYPYQQLYAWYWGNLNDVSEALQDSTVPLFNGIDTAGPDLNPDTFRDGLFSIPPVGGTATGGISPQYSFGKGQFPWANYAGYTDFTELYWDPTAQAAVGSTKVSVGQYQYLNGGKRYVFGSWPSGEPKMFDPKGTVIKYNNYPAGDTPPKYTCAGCPSAAS